MEAIPNKITDTMGIVADVNLLYENEMQYIEIIVDKYPALISYHGKYFYRSGSTMRTITGKELDKAILKSQGRTWYGMPIPKLKVEDLRLDTIEGIISIREVMELTKKSRTTAWRYMQMLVDCKAVEVAGSTNNVSYKRRK